MVPVFEIASRTDNVVGLLAFIVVAILFVTLSTKKDKDKHKVIYLGLTYFCVIAMVVLIGVFGVQLLGLSNSRTYQVTITVLTSDKQPADLVDVVADMGSVAKVGAGRWTITVPSQYAGSGKSLEVVATAKDPMATGSTVVALGSDLYPSETIILGHVLQKSISGIIVSRVGKPVENAAVSVEGSPKVVAMTDNKGNFLLPVNQPKESVVILLVDYPSGPDLRQTIQLDGSVITLRQ